MKTLADMAPDERTECVGLWCYVFDRGDEPPTGEGIIAGYRESDDGQTFVVVIHPRPDAGQWRYALHEVSPRAELPRAWMPGGQSPQVEYQYAEYRPGTHRGFYTLSETTEKGPELAEGTTEARRWVGQWEEL